MFIKQQYSILSGSFCFQDFSPCKFKSTIEVEAPTTKIYRFQGTIIHPSGETVPVGTENLILRECLLKNTDFIEGIVVYAGNIPSYKISIKRKLQRSVFS